MGLMDIIVASSGGRKKPTGAGPAPNPALVQGGPYTSSTPSSTPVISGGTGYIAPSAPVSWAGGTTSLTSPRREERPNPLDPRSRRGQVLDRLLSGLSASGKVGSLNQSESGPRRVSVNQQEADTVNDVLGYAGFESKVRPGGVRVGAYNADDSQLPGPVAPGPQRRGPVTAGMSPDAIVEQANQRRMARISAPPTVNTEDLRGDRGGSAADIARGRGAEQDPRRSSRVNVAVPDVVPEQYRKAVAKYGQMLNDPLKGTGVSGPEYLGNLIQFESGWNPDAHNPSGAHGLGQFMPYTRDSFVSQYGIDPYGSPKEAIKGAAAHASGDYGHNPLYAGYNPGYSDTDPIMELINQGGGMSNVKVREKALKKVAGGDITGTGGGSTEPRQVGGAWAGSQKVLRQVLGGRKGPIISQGGEYADWKDKEDRGYSSLHDINSYPNAIAGDLPADELVTDTIAKNLGLDPKQVNYNESGTLEGAVPGKPGYEYEFLPFDHGGGPHNHIGIEWTGEEAPPGTFMGGTVPTSSGGGGMPAPASGGSTGSPATDLLLSQYSDARAEREQGTNNTSGLVRNPLSARAVMPTMPTVGNTIGTGSEDGSEEKLSDEDEELMAQLEYGFTPRRRRPQR